MVRAIALCLGLLECSCILTNTTAVMPEPLSVNNATEVITAPFSVNDVMLVSFNPMSACTAGRLDELSNEFRTVDTIALAGCGGAGGEVDGTPTWIEHLRWHWGLMIGHGGRSSTAAGIIVMRKRSRFRERHSTKLVQPKASLRGGGGGVQLRCAGGGVYWPVNVHRGEGFAAYSCTGTATDCMLAVRGEGTAHHDDARAATTHHLCDMYHMQVFNKEKPVDMNDGETASLFIAKEENPDLQARFEKFDPADIRHASVWRSALPLGFEPLDEYAGPFRQASAVRHVVRRHKNGTRLTDRSIQCRNSLAMPGPIVDDQFEDEDFDEAEEDEEEYDLRRSREGQIQVQLTFANAMMKIKCTDYHACQREGKQHGPPHTYICGTMQSYRCLHPRDGGMSSTRQKGGQRIRDQLQGQEPRELSGSELLRHARTALRLASSRSLRADRVPSSSRICGARTQQRGRGNANIVSPGESLVDQVRVSRECGGDEHARSRGRFARLHRPEGDTSLLRRLR